MNFDFKKEYKEFYMPKMQPAIVEIPKMNYIAVRGKGNPNEPNGAYQEAIQILYAISYTLKMSYKTEYKIKDFFPYVVPPLEGFWSCDIPRADVELWGEQSTMKEIPLSYKEKFLWTSVIRLPDFIEKEDFAWAVKEVEKKKKIDCSKAEFISIEEGLCVQIMHIGSFDAEYASVEKMNEYIKAEGYITDINESRQHHEIYLFDARKIPPEKWKTVIRHPIRKRET